MGSLVRWVFALGTLAAFAAGCGRSGPFDDGGGFAPTPRFPGGGETPTPTPVQGLSMPYGDGHDGELSGIGVGAVINECAVLTTGSNGQVTLANVPPKISAGTVILVWQVQNDFATLADQSDIDDPLRAGRWELTRVSGVDGTTLAVFPALASSYGTSGTTRAQACNVPEYTNVTVATGESIVGEPWAADALHGIVAFFANGTVTLEGTISVDAMGFRGGLPSGMSAMTNVTADDSTNDMEAGGKGEGLDARGFGRFARGNCSNGGGGGNASRAGGGGGGNGGLGGRGGLEKSGDGDDTVSRGLAGARVTAITNRLLPGGGGGGGHRALVGSNSRGGHGGGVVLMMVKTLAGVAGVVSAAGEDAPIVGNDGSGGGGAGGMIDLRVEDGDGFDGDLVANGGNGADNTQGGGGVRYGPGGGGGGGIIRVLGPLGDVDAIVTRGANGESSGDSHDAQDGQDGSENVP